MPARGFVEKMRDLDTSELQARERELAEQIFRLRFQLTSGGLRACFSLFGRSVTLGPCVGIDVEHIDAYGVGSTTTNAGSANIWSPLAGALLRWTPARWLGLVAIVDVAFPITRPSFAGKIARPDSASQNGKTTPRFTSRRPVER